jgi:hypothetical protein
LDRIEIVNTENQKKTVFPCNKWLSKKKEDGEIARDLYPLMDEEERHRSSKDLRSSSGGGGGGGKRNHYDDFESNSKVRNKYQDFDSHYDNHSRGSGRRNEY